MQLTPFVLSVALALPALAQATPPAPVQEPAKQEPAEKEAAEPAGQPKDPQRAAVVLLRRIDPDAKLAVQAELVRVAAENRIRLQLAPAAHKVVLARLGADGQVLPVRRHAGKVPAADAALADVQAAAEKARTAQDLAATLAALDEIERAVMRARAALHGAPAEDKAEDKKKE